MQVPVFHSNGYHQTGEEEHINVFQILTAHNFGIKNAKKWKEHHREESSGGQRDAFSGPEHGHEHDGVGGKTNL